MSIPLDPINLFLVIKSKEKSNVQQGYSLQSYLQKDCFQFFLKYPTGLFINSQILSIIEYLSVTKNSVFKKFNDKRNTLNVKRK